MAVLSYPQSLQYLSDENWKQLNPQQKIGVLQAVETEMARRQIRDECKVEAVSMPSKPGAVTLGAYDPTNGNIAINSDQLTNESEYGKGSEVHLDTVLHEGRHAYQHQAVTGKVYHPNPQEVAEWSENMAPGNYVKFEENPRGYYYQPIERDARDYAQKMSQQIKVESMLSEKNSQIDVAREREQFSKQMSNTSEVKEDLLVAKEVYNNQNSSIEDKGVKKDQNQQRKRAL